MSVEILEATGDTLTPRAIVTLTRLEWARFLQDVGALPKERGRLASTS